MCLTEVDGRRLAAAEPDCAGVRRWTNKFKDLLNYDYIVVPVNLPGHWVLVVVNFARRRIQYFDSSRAGAGAGDTVDFNSISGSLPRCLDVSLPRCLVASLPRCFAPPSPDLSQLPQYCLLDLV
jgi:hypothetical protein